MWGMHDLLLISRLALLQTGRQNVATGYVSNRHARSTDFAAQYHRPMRDDPHKYHRWLWPVEGQLRKCLGFGWGCQTEEQDERETQSKPDEGRPRRHFTLVPGSTSSRTVSSPRT